MTTRKSKPVARTSRAGAKTPKTRPAARAAGSTRSAPPAEDVAGFLRASKHPLLRELELLRGLILGAHPQVREGIQWNAASFRTTDWFATLNGPRHTKGPLVVLHAGAKAKGLVLRGRVEDPAGLLQWRGADRALVVFRDAGDITARRKAFQTLVRAWVESL